MPKFKYQLANGKTLTLEGDTQPSDEEVESIAAEQGLQLQPVDTTPPPVQNIPEPSTPNIAPTAMETQPVAPEPKSRSIYQHIFEPPEAVTNIASRMAQSITEPSMATAPTGEGGLSDYFKGVLARARGFAAGATEGAANLLSPANILTAGRGRLPQIASQILGGVQATHGAVDLASGDISGLGDIGLGALGLSAPKVTPKLPEKVPSKVPKGWDINEMRGASMKGEEPPLVYQDDAVTEAGNEILRKSGEFDPASLKFGKPEVLPVGEGAKSIDEFIESGFKVPNYNEVADNGAIWIDNLYGKGMGGYGTEKEIAFINDTNRMKRNKGEIVPPEFKPPKVDEVSGLIKESGLESADVPVEIISEAPYKSELPAWHATLSDEALAKEMARKSNPKQQAAMDARNKGFRGTEQAPQQPQPKPSPEEAVQQLQKSNVVGAFANETQKKSLWQEVRDANRALLTSFDFSAAGRQGKPLMMTKAYWTSFDDMFKSWGSQRAYDNVIESINELPSFQRTQYQTVNKAGKTVTKTASLAERAGLDIGGKEETFKSNFAENLIPGVKRSERAYSAFLNKLRADHFNTMVNDARNMGLNPDKNDVVLKQIGSFINDATGRGGLGRLEQAAPILNEVFFAPRLMASRVNMYKRWLNPKTYSNENPVVRKQALKSLLSTVGFGLTVGEVARQAGAQVNNDPRSSDFRKAKIGNTRIDPFSGFQQYAVGAARLLSGETVSTSPKHYGREYDLTSGDFGMPTRASIVSQFAQNKLAPIPSLVWSWMEGKDWSGEPFEVKAAILDRTVPIVMQDLYELYQEDPNLLPLGILPVFGEGLQTYGR